MRKSAFCICENKDADQLRSNRKADQRLCFHYIDSIIPLLPKYEISSLQTSSVVVQQYRTRSETQKTCFLTTKLKSALLVSVVVQSNLIGNPEDMHCKNTQF